MLGNLCSTEYFRREREALLLSLTRIFLFARRTYYKNEPINLTDELGYKTHAPTANIFNLVEVIWTIGGKQRTGF